MLNKTQILRSLSITEQNSAFDKPIHHYTVKVIAHPTQLFAKFIELKQSMKIIVEYCIRTS